MITASAVMDAILTFQAAPGFSLRLFPVSVLSEVSSREAAKATATNAGVLIRAWDLWKAKALAGTAITKR